MFTGPELINSQQASTVYTLISIVENMYSLYYYIVIYIIFMPNYCDFYTDIFLSPKEQKVFYRVTRSVATFMKLDLVSDSLTLLL